MIKNICKIVKEMYDNEQTLEKNSSFFITFKFWVIKSQKGCH